MITLFHLVKKILKIGKNKAILGLGIPPIFGGKEGQIKPLEIHMSQAMRKCVLCHMRTTTAQISLRIHAV